MTISVSRPHAQYKSHAAAIDAAVRRVFESERYILGPELERFEADFATWCGAPHVVGVASGTDAITIALLALGIGPGDEVITVSHTAVATIAGITRSGATAVMVDIDPTTWTIDPKAAAAAVGSRTRAIVPVHLYGQPADMDAVTALARSHGLAVIEDCAQAHGATWRGQRVGSIGDAGAFSFYPTKNLGAIGDGGALTLRDQSTAARARQIREYGWDHNRVSQLCGLNSRLDELQAAILRAKLPSLNDDNSRRVAVAAQYAAALADSPLQLPCVRAGASHVWHLYVVAHAERELLREHLAARGIAAGVHYPRPAHRHPAWANARTNELPHTDRAANEVLSLPIYPELSQHDLDIVIAAVRSYFVESQ